jgi:tetratricopeptide (TPR) repeat protein
LSYRRFYLGSYLVICLLSYPALADFELNLNKGLAAYLEKDYQTAVKFLKEAITENPDNATVNHILGVSLLRLDNYDESLKYLEKAKSLDPNIRGIYLDLGIAYLGINDLKRALPEFEEAVRRDPSGIAYYNLGYTQYRLGYYREAIDSLEKAAELDPDVAVQSRYYQGLSRYRVPDYEGAKGDFQSVRDMRPGTNLAASAQEYLDAIARATKKYYGAVSTGVQYDDNVVLEPDEIQISDQADVRAIFYLNLGYKPYLKPDAVIGADYSAFLSFHKDLEDFNVQDHRFKLYGEKRSSLREKPVSYYLEYFYDLVLVDGSPADNLFSQTHSVGPRAFLRWSNTSTTELSYQIRYDNFDDIDERDAINNNLTVAQIFRLYDGRLQVKPGLNFAVNSADDTEGTRSFDYTSPQVFVEGLAFLPFGVTVFTDAHYFREDYYNDPFDRVDNQIGVRVIVSKKLHSIFSLDLGYQHISNLSDSDVPGPEPFDYSRNIFSATFSARF